MRPRPPRPQSRRAIRPALAVPAPPPAAPRRPPRRNAMIVESSRDAPDGGDGGALSSPINLAYFYGASPHSSEGSCSPAHSSAPGSPGSDSDLSVSSRGGGRRDPRGGPRPALQGTAGPVSGGRGAAGPAPGPRGEPGRCSRRVWQRPERRGEQRARVWPALAARCRALPSLEREQRAAPGTAEEPHARGMAGGTRGSSLALLLNRDLGAFLQEFRTCLGFFCFYYLLNKKGGLSSGFVFMSSQLNNTWGGESSTEDLSRGSA